MQETRPGRDIVQNLGDWAVIGYVAASFAGEEQFSSQPVIFFKKQYPRSPIRRDAGSQHTRRASANYRNVVHIKSQLFPFHASADLLPFFLRQVPPFAGPQRSKPEGPDRYALQGQNRKPADIAHLSYLPVSSLGYRDPQSPP